MAAFDLPWMSSAPPSDSLSHGKDPMESGSMASMASRDPKPPTIASFSPPSSSPAIKSSQQVAQKSPLLVATPPQVTRALSQSHPYIRAGNHVMGLLTWTTKDPWESFLLVAAFWAIALYGAMVLKYAGTILAVAGLALGMYLRRFNNVVVHPSLDEILDTLNTFTTRLNIFFEPFYTLTTFLSTQKTPTTATTAPAIITLAIRVLIVSPIWLLLTFFNVITPRRIVLAVGTVILSWHSRPSKVTRTILWRSATIRNLCEQMTGLQFTIPPKPTPPVLPPRNKDASASTASLASTASVNGSTSSKALAHRSTSLQPGGVTSPGVKFTFVIYENQRRWLGIGWNTSLFAYERAPWTDENLEPCPPPAEFHLPETPPSSVVKWRWVPGEDWRVENAEADHINGGKKQHIKDKLGGSGQGGEGWIYYDNKWNNGSRAGDGWGKYTRRRKWIRNAELIEDHDESEGRQHSEQDKVTEPPPPKYAEPPAGAAKCSPKTGL